jgi:hypothetical protein
MVRVMPLSDYEFIWQDEDGNARLVGLMEKSCLMIWIDGYCGIGRRSQA